MSARVPAVEIDKVFKPFMSKGFLSLTGSEGDQVPVTILRDPSAKHSVARCGVVPFSDQSYCGSDLLVWGVRMNMFGMPLHSFTLFPPFRVRVGVQDQLPVAGIDLILGNDLPRGKVFPATPKVTENPAADVFVHTPSGLSVSSVLPACVVTRAQAVTLVMWWTFPIGS